MPHDKKYDPDWQVAKTHFDADLHAVAHTNDGPYAVGASGVVATSTDHGWVPIIHSGPSAQNSILRDVAATGDGRRIWFAGASGALGMYDVKKQKKYDYSFPGDITDSWHAIAATGKSGQERGLIANGSGSVVPYTVDGTDVKWGTPAKPGGGSAITDLALDPNGVAYAADTSGNVYRAKDGKSWTKIGIPDAQVSLNHVHANEKNVYVAADSGRLYRYDPSAKKWTPIDIAQTPLRAVDIHKEHIVVLADDNTFYWRTISGETRWQQVSAPTGKDLLDLALGYPDTAVGKAGAVVVKPPFEPPKEEEKKKEKHKDPKKKTQKEPHPDPCPLILEELLERVETEQLLELLETRGCYTKIVEQLKTSEETEITELLQDAELIPLLLAEEEEEHRHTGLRERREVEDDYVLVPREEVHTHKHEAKSGCAGSKAELEAEEIDIEALKRLLKR